MPKADNKNCAEWWVCYWETQQGRLRIKLARKPRRCNGKVDAFCVDSSMRKYGNYRVENNVSEVACVEHDESMTQPA